MKNNKKKYYWKVVFNYNGIFESAIMNNTSLGVTYSIGKFTTSQNELGLFCFKTRDLARKFKRECVFYSSLKILKVECMDFIAEYDYPPGTITFRKVLPFKISR